MKHGVHVIGGARTDFRRNFSKEGRTLADAVVEAGRAALADAEIDPTDVQAGVVGNFASGLFTQQLHLGALLIGIDERLRGLPTMHVEAACASGGVAALTAAKFILGGLHDVVLVVGAEQQKTMAPAAGAKVLGAAGDFAAESAEYGEFMFPKLFGRIAELYRQRHGLTEEQLAAVAVKNHAHARLNPLAQMRDSKLTLAAACAESEANPRIAPPLKVTDCSQITDGAAAVVLCSDEFARRRGRKPSARLLGYGHTTDRLALGRKDAPDFSIAARAAQQAYDMAGLKPADLHGAEVHDCFSISEIIAYEVLGFAPRGGGAALAQSGATMLPVVRSTPGGSHPAFSFPVNPGGGLMGDGHPVGATGVRQVADAYFQLTQRANRTQIEGAKHFLTFNMGGSVTTSVVMIWGG